MSETLGLVFHVDDGEEHLREFVGYDPSYRIVHYAAWSSWEEHGCLYILEKDGTYFALESGSSVYATDNTPYFEPNSVSEQEAMELLSEWAEIDSDAFY